MWEDRMLRTGGARVIRILIADDTHLFREALAAGLTHLGSLDLVVETACVAECCGRIEAFRPNIMLLHTAVGDRIVNLQAILRMAPEVRVVALGVNGTEEEVVQLAEAGAAGYLPRDGSLG
jgi:DNA-binding NarL/FixJ family response regulator